jgi:hypothetical protein
VFFLSCFPFHTPRPWIFFRFFSLFIGPPFSMSSSLRFGFFSSRRVSSFYFSPLSSLVTLLFLRLALSPLNASVVAQCALTRACLPSLPPFPSPSLLPSLPPSSSSPHRCLDPVLTIVSLLSTKSPFVLPLGSLPPSLPPALPLRSTPLISSLPFLSPFCFPSRT